MVGSERGRKRGVSLGHKHACKYRNREQYLGSFLRKKTKLHPIRKEKNNQFLFRLCNLNPHLGGIHELRRRGFLKQCKKHSDIFFLKNFGTFRYEILFISGTVNDVAKQLLKEIFYFSCRFVNPNTRILFTQYSNFCANEFYGISFSVFHPDEMWLDRKMISKFDVEMSRYGIARRLSQLSEAEKSEQTVQHKHQFSFSFSPKFYENFIFKKYSLSLILTSMTLFVSLKLTQNNIIASVGQCSSLNTSSISQLRLCAINFCQTFLRQQQIEMVMQIFVLL